MMNYSDETADESAKLQDEMDRLNLWDLEQQVEMAMEALGCPPKEADVTNLSGGERRRVALCQLLLRAARPAAARRADQPSRRRDDRVAGKASARTIKGAVLIITHDRYFLDNVTGWILELDRGRGIPYEGNYTAYLEAKAKRLKQEGREDDARQKAICARARVDRVQPEGAADQVEGPHQGLSRIWSSRPTSAGRPTRRSSSRMASGSAMSSSRSTAWTRAMATSC